MGVWKDPIRPAKPGRREGGEASWTPQIGQEKPRAWDIFRGPMKTWADRTPWQWTLPRVPCAAPADLHLLGREHRNPPPVQDDPSWALRQGALPTACTEPGTAPSLESSPNKAWVPLPTVTGSGWEWRSQIRG